MDSSSSSPTFLTTITSPDHQTSRNPPKHHHQKKKKTTSSSSINKSIKVRYISNPKRVKTCASKFRQLVQELTGQDAVDINHEEEPLSDYQTLSPPPTTTEENILQPSVVFHQEPLDDRVVDCYEPSDGEEMFLPDQMSAGFSGFFTNGFYNVNDFGRIDSM